MVLTPFCLPFSFPIYTFIYNFSLTAIPPPRFPIIDFGIVYRYCRGIPGTLVVPLLPLEVHRLASARRTDGSRAGSQRSRSGCLGRSPPIPSGIGQLER